MHYGVKVLGVLPDCNECFFDAFFIGYVGFYRDDIFARIAELLVKGEDTPAGLAEFLRCRASHTAAGAGYEYIFHHFLPFLKVTAIL